VSTNTSLSFKSSPTTKEGDELSSKVISENTSSNLDSSSTTNEYNETDGHTRKKGVIAGVIAGVNAGVNAGLNVGADVVAGVNAGVNVGVDAVISTFGKRTSSVKRKHGRPHRHTSFIVPEKINEINEINEINQEEDCCIESKDNQECNPTIDMNEGVFGRSEFYSHMQSDFDENLYESRKDKEVKIKKPTHGKGGFFHSFSYHPYSNSDKSKEGACSKKEKLRRSSCELDKSVLKELQKKNIHKDFNTADSKKKQPLSQNINLTGNDSGAIPKAPTNTSKEIYKKNDAMKGKPPKPKKKDEVTRPKSAGAVESAKKEDSLKQKKPLTATSSVPFWLKLSDDISLDNALSKMSKATSSSDSGPIGRKMGHKRTRSYDLSQMFRDTDPLVRLKRSTSFEHLENLRDPKSS
ncbi:unnamed protein product, partial [Meganyctiphanes norvegica]